MNNNRRRIERVVIFLVFATFLVAKKLITYLNCKLSVYDRQFMRRVSRTGNRREKTK